MALHDDSIRPDSRFRCVVALIRSSGVTRLHTTVRRSEHDQDNWWTLTAPVLWGTVPACHNGDMEPSNPTCCWGLQLVYVDL